MPLPTAYLQEQHVSATRPIRATRHTLSRVPRVYLPKTVAPSLEKGLCLQSAYTTYTLSNPASLSYPQIHRRKPS